MKLFPYKMGILGAGNMGEAILRGLLIAKLFKPKEILISNRNPKKRAAMHRKYKVATTASNATLLDRTQTVIFAIKPQDCGTVLPPLKKNIGKGHLFISVMTGVDTKKLRKMLGKNLPFVRVSPNLPALIGSGIAGIYCAGNVRVTQKRLAHKIFEAVGKSVDVPKEKWLDAITGLSGTGPAYAFALMEGLIQAGQKVGLPKWMAEQLTLHTVLGAAKMAAATSLSPKALRSKVTSKKGTTWAAMKVFRKRGFWATVVKAVAAATKRAKVLKYY